MVYWSQAEDNPLFQTVEMNADAKYYTAWAEEIAFTDFLGQETFFMGPLYPYFLAGIYRVSGVEVDAVRALQLALGVFACFLTYLLADRLAGRRVAYIALVLTAFSPVSLFYELQILPTVLVLLFSTLFAYLIVSILPSERKSPSLRFGGRSWLSPFLLGLTLGLAVLAKANALLIAPFALILFWMVLPRREFSRYALLLIAGAAIIISPVSIRNLALGGDLVLVSSNGGVNFYIGTNDESDGTYRTPGGIVGDPNMLQTEAAEAILGISDAEGQRASRLSWLWFRRGVEFVLDSPTQYLTLLGRKSLLFLNRYEAPINDSFYFARQNASVLKIPLTFWIIGSLGIAGMFFSLRKWREYFIPYSFVVIQVVTCLVFFVSSRYRLPALPFLSIFAGVYLLDLWRRIRLKETRSVILRLGVVTGLLLVGNMDITHGRKDRDLAFGYNKIGDHYQRENQPSRARDAYLLALQADPQLSATHYNLGRLIARSDPESAVSRFQRAIELEPDNADYHSGLGTLYLRSGQMDRAMEEYQLGNQIDPDHGQSLMGIGLVYLYYNRLDDAVANLTEALQADPDLADAHFFLGYAHYSRGELKRAREEKAAAIALDPKYAGSDYESMLESRVPK